MTTPQTEERTVEIRPEEVFISFDLPLKPDCERALKYYVERYTDAEGNPLEPKYTESLVILHIPRTLKLKGCGNGKPLPTEASSVHGVSSNG